MSLPCIDSSTFKAFYFSAWLNLILALNTIALTTAASGELRVAHIFGDNMVIQRDKPIHVWGWAKPGKNVRVRFTSRDMTERVNELGEWSIEFDGLSANSQAQSLSVTSEQETINYDGIVIGDVWLLGGQSNMEDVLEDIYHGDTEVASANNPNIRLLTIPQQASSTPLKDIERLNEFNSWTGRFEQKGTWFQCTPNSVSRFSAIGYIFGRRLHQVSGIPIGLIDASWGGTTAEAWTSRKTIGSIDEAKPLLEEWDEKIANYDAKVSLIDRIKRWEQNSERRKQEGKQPNPNPKPTEPDQDPASDRNNPGASYNGMIAPYAAFNIKGAIFNQGYNNALGDSRPKLYEKVFSAMIRDWRAVFRDEVLPFGIVELTAGGEPQTLENFERQMVDAAPFIREAQQKAWQDLDGIGFAPAYDQQVPWYHPHKKFELGERIARWALFTQYGQEQLGWRPVVCKSWENTGDHFVLSFDGQVRVHDGRPFSGFAIAGADRHFYPASAEFVISGKDARGDVQNDESKLKVWSPFVKQPQAVRYAWARNPIGNAVNSRHHERTIPVPSFRTDDWDWPEAPIASQSDDGEHRQRINQMRRQADLWAKERKLQTARHVLATEKE